MNILFITAGMGYGGAEKMLAFAANSLSRRGHSVSVVNLNMTSRELCQEIDNQVTVYNIDGKKPGFRKLGCVKEIGRISKGVQAELLIGFTMYPNLYAALVGKRLGIPAIMSERGDPNRTFGKRLLEKLLIAVINSCTGGIFQTEAARQFYGKKLQKNGVVIPNPIFMHSTVPEVTGDQRKKTVVSVGRLENLQKRYDVMLEAFRIFHQKHPEYSLKIYGDGPDEQQIRCWAQTKGIAQQVHFMGLTRNTMQDIAHDGMFLITSDFEGISNALLEAMAVGLPCVSTDHTPGGARLLITDHENGLLAPVADPEKLATAMCEFAEDPQLAERCAQKAKEVTDRFAPERIADMWENYCKQATKRTFT